MPRPEVVKKALAEIRKRAVNYEYFFDRLKSPEWIEPLFSEGMFRHPPPPKREGDYISFPFWPESRYLARMAALVPEVALEIALQIPDTSNIRVHEDFADAACEMPPELAARWAKEEAHWVRSQEYLYILLPEKLGALVSHLAKGSQVDQALDLASAVLTVLPGPEDARARFDAWHYEQILKQHIPDLVTAAEMDALTLLCDLLEDAVRLSERHKGDEGPEDQSYIWRPAIEDHDQNRRHGLKGLLVSAVRDSAEALMETKGKAVLEFVEGRPFKIFKRIGLHLRRKWPEVDPKGTASLVADPNVFDDICLHHEFFHLLREQFDSLHPEAQQAYLDSVAQGIDARKWLDFRERETGRRPSREKGESYVRHRQYKKLWPIQEFLDQKWRQRFDALKGEFGKLDHPDFDIYMSPIWTGPTSPKTVEDLSSMSIEALVSLLKTWQPSRDPRSPSPEGLGRELTTLIASEPKRFAAESEQFEGLDPTYVRALVSGLREAAEQRVIFPWSSLLDLCRWVMDQPREIPGRKGQYDDLDTHWGWARKAIADLLSAGFELNVSGIPFDFRAASWEILKPLTDDPNPTLEDEARYGGSNMDPATLSINTTRGEAMHAVVRYALWVRRHLKEAPNGKERLAQGFDEMSEVRAVLDHHLDPDRDPALAIRAVYGQWFPWFVLLDPRWAAQSVARIFPADETLHDLRDAAWGTYITFCDAYDNVFDILRKEYGSAVNRIGSTWRKTPGWMTDPDRRLAQHLMVLYWRGKLNSDESDGLLGQFYAKASDALCGHALEFVGQSLHSTKEAVASQIRDRLRALWATRLEAACCATPPSLHAAELAAFGWWFVSDLFDDTWAIEQLKEALKLSGRVQPDHLVVERLATLADDMPLPAVECLGLIIEGDKEGWGIHGWREHTRTLLATALQSTDETAQQAAVDLVHRLGARGYLAFRDLLSKIERC